MRSKPTLPSANSQLRSKSQSSASRLTRHASGFEDKGQLRGHAGLLAFSLVEIIITVGLMSIIMLGLLMAFNQTQRAFKTSMTQVDVLESGRAATSLIAREMGHITPSYDDQRSFFADIRPGGPPPAEPLRQPLPGTGNGQRLNLLEDVFFLTRENLTWTGIGYFVRVENNGTLQFPIENVTNIMGGHLYRFEDRLPVSNRDAPYWLFTNFVARLGNNAVPGDVTKQVMNGVVHFKVRTFGVDGNWITNNAQWIVATNLDGALFPPEVRRYEFTSNAVPAAVEFELGLLEDRIWERYKSIPAGDARYQYLAGQVGRVHVFRQRVAVRNVDPAAYR